MNLMVAKTLTLIALVGMLHWLFGNLYEAVVFSPNMVLDTAVQLDRMHGLFARTSPATYFVPVSFVAPALAWAAHAFHRDRAVTSDFRRASVFAALATALNAFIVATTVIVLFASDYRTHSATELHALCVRWNVLNAVRIALCAGTAFWLFAAFRKLDRLALGAATPATALPVSTDPGWRG
jgi:hypothetical protein